MSDGPAVVIVDPVSGAAANTKAASTAAVATDLALVVAVSPNNTVAVTGALTNAELRAAVVPVGDGGGSLTVDGTVAVSGTVPVSGPLTDTQLRAAVVPVGDGGGSLTVDGTVAVSGTVPVSGPLTDTQLRAAVVPVGDGGGSLTVDGTVAATDGGGSLTVDDGGGSLTVDVGSLPLPTGAATEATLATMLTQADFNARVNTLGQKVKAESTPITIASDQEPFAVFIDSPIDAVVGIATGTVVLGGSTASTIQVIRSTPYTEQSSNAVRSLKSSSANDAAAGTGARKVIVTYYNAAMAGPFTETVTLNGTTAVALTATNVCFIESLHVSEVGSGGANAGTISLYANNVGTGTVIGSIGLGSIVSGVGDNRTFWAHHYVASDQTATLATYIVAAASGGSGTNATFFLRSHNPTNTLAPDVVVSDLLVTTASIVRQLTNPIKVIGPARITAYGVPAVNNATLNASFDFSERST